MDRNCAVSTLEANCLARNIRANVAIEAQPFPNEGKAVVPRSRQHRELLMRSAAKKLKHRAQR